MLQSKHELMLVSPPQGYNPPPIQYISITLVLKKSLMRGGSSFLWWLNVSRCVVVVIGVVAAITVVDWWVQFGVRGRQWQWWHGRCDLRSLVQAIVSDSKL